MIIGRDVGFRPTQVNGCTLWLRADMGVTQLTTGSVSAWADQSGQGHHFSQAVAGSYPSFSTNGAVNGRPCLQFNGSTQSLTRATAILSTSPWTVFTIAQCNAPSVEGFIFSVGNSSNGMAVGADGVSSARALWYPGSAVLGDGTLSAAWEALTSRNDGTTSTLLLNGANQILTNSTTQPLSPSPVSNVGVGLGTNFWSGGIAEVIAYNRALTPSEVAAVNAYFLARYWV